MMKLISAGILLSCLPMSAQAITIDFEQLNSFANTSFIPSPYVEDGFQLTALSGGFTSVDELSTNYSGSAALSNNTFGGETELTRVGGGSFNLISIDLTEFFSNTNGATATFTRDGGFSQSFTLDANFFVPETFFFDSAFAGTTSLRFVNTLPFYQFDNIEVTVSPVPIPAAAWLFGSALLGFFGLRRKKWMSLRGNFN